MSAYIPIFLVVACLGLWLSLATEQSQIVAKIRGASSGRIAFGYMRAQQIMILNRFGVITYMLLLAFCIDLGVENWALLLVGLTTTFLVFSYNFFVLVRRKTVLRFDGEDSDLSLMKIVGSQSKWIFAASYAATVLNVLGLTMPLLLSNSFPAYRLTLANTSFLFNTFFTLITVLFIERQFAIILDKEDRKGAFFFVATVFVSRQIALITLSLIFAVLFIYLG